MGGGGTMETTIKKKLKYTCLTLSSTTCHLNFVNKNFFFICSLLYRRKKNARHVCLLVIVNI